MTTRLFIALEIPDSVLGEIINLRDEIYGHDASVKWESKDKLHITLKFLGDVSNELVPEIIRILEEIIEDRRSFECSFVKFGLFYKFNKPRILWLGTQLSDELKEIKNTIESRISDLGFERERRQFKAHLTLLRVKGKEDFNKLEKFGKVEFKPIKFSAQNLALIKSELKPTGSEYTTIKRFKLS